MLSRFATIDVGGVSRDERTSRGDMLRTAFSVSTLGLTAFTAYHQFTNPRKWWGKFPKATRQLLERPFPWEAQAEYAATQRVAQHVMQTPQSILDLAVKYDSPTMANTKAVLTQGMATEIRDLEAYLNNSRPSRLYLSRARTDTFHISDIVNMENIADAYSEYPETTRKYRNNLRKYMALYDRNTPIVRATSNTDIFVGDQLLRHNTLLNQQASQLVPVEYDFGRLRYRPMQIPDTWGRTSSGFSIRQFLADAESGGRLRWSNRDIYQRIPGYSNLNIAKSDAALGRIYRRLSSIMSRKAQEGMAPGSDANINSRYSITPQLMDQGAGAVAIRFSMDLTMNKAGEDVRVTDHIDIPLGNTGTIRMEGGTFVGGLEIPSGSTELLGPEVQIARAIEDKADSIVDDLSTGNTIRAKAEVRNLMTTKVVPSKGGLTDLGVRLTVEQEDLMMISPTYQVSREQRRVMTEELRGLRHKVHGMRYVSGNAAGRAKLVGRMEIIKAQLGIGYDTTEQMREIHRRMGMMLDPAGDPLIYYWEKSATHAGAGRYASILGMGPATWEANPQSSIYQFYNTYPLAPTLHTTYPIRWGGDTLVSRWAETNFMTARVAYTGDLYPFSESEVWTSPQFKARIGRARDLAASRLGTGDAKSIPIAMVDGVAQINRKQVALNNMLTELHASAPNMELDAPVAHGIVSAHGVRLQPRSIVGFDENGEAIRTGKFASVVTGVRTKDGRLVLDTDVMNTSSNRVVPVLGRGSGMVAKDIRLLSTSLGTNRPLDMIMRGRVGERLTHQLLEVATVADAVDQLRLDATNQKYIMGNMKYTAVRRAVARKTYYNDIGRLKGVARLMGGSYDQGMNEIHLPAAWTRTKELIHMQNLKPAQVDQILIMAKRVYRADDPTLPDLRMMWDQYGERYLKNIGAPQSIMDRYKIAPGLPARIGLVSSSGHTLMTQVSLDMVGIMRQNHKEMLKTYGLKTGVEAGFPFRFTELGLLLDRFMRAPEPVRGELNTAMEKYVGYLVGQMGGAEADSEYLRILGQTAGMDAPAGAIRIGDDLHTEFNALLARTNLPGLPGTEMTYIIDGVPVHGAGAMAAVAEARAVGKEVAQVAGYRIRNSDLGVLGDRRFLGRHIELPYEVELNIGGISGKTRYAYFGDPRGMKLQPTQVSGAGGPYTIVPQYQYRMVRAMEAARAHMEVTSNRAIQQIEYNVGAGTGVPTGRMVVPGRPGAGTLEMSRNLTQSNMNLAMTGAMEDWFLGKHSYLRRHDMMAWESGIQGVVMSMPDQITHGSDKFKFGGKYGPSDIIVASRRLDSNLREVIMNNLVEKNSNLPLDKAREAARIEFNRIATGKQAFPVMATRFPVISEMGRSPGMMFFEPKLNKMGDYADYLFIGELLQRATWGDFDFDMYQFAIAKHWGGSEALQEILTVGADRGKTRVYEGTARFRYATGMEEFGSGALEEGAYTTKLLGVKHSKAGLVVPKVYRLRSIDKGVGYHIQTLGVSHDTRYGNYLGDWNTLVNPESGKAYSFQPGEWTNIITAAAKEGREMDPATMAVIDAMNPEDRAAVLSRPGVTAHIKTLLRGKVDLYTGLLAQKGYVGSATSYAMAINLLASQNLTREETAILTPYVGSSVQRILQAKKWVEGNTDAEFAKYGQYTRAMRNVETMGDEYSRILMAGPKEGGFGWSEAAVAARLKLPTTAMSRIFPDAGISYELLHRSSNFRRVSDIIMDLQGHMEGNPDMTTLAIAKETGLQDFLLRLGKQVNAAGGITIPEAGAPAMAPGLIPTGYFARKPFIGPLGRNRIADTLLADSMGKGSAEVVKAGLVGAGILGGLYLAMNMFRPNQMGSLGEMPGLGGEFWGPLRGRRMELPWGVPIDTPEYTWDAPPFDRKARVELFNPFDTEKMAAIPGRLLGTTTPATNWGIAPSTNTRYNNRSRGNRYAIRNAIRSSRVIMAS